MPATIRITGENTSGAAFDSAVDDLSETKKAAEETGKSLEKLGDKLEGDARDTEKLSQSLGVTQTNLKQTRQEVSLITAEWEEMAAKREAVNELTRSVGRLKDETSTTRIGIKSIKNEMREATPIGYAAAIAAVTGGLAEAAVEGEKAEITVKKVGKATKEAGDSAGKAGDGAKGFGIAGLAGMFSAAARSEEHTSELQSH